MPALSSHVVQTLIIPNPMLVAAPWDFRSVTEKRDLMRKTPCQPEDPNGDGISSTSAGYPCQRGCGNEKPFFYIVEPGDSIPMQFQFLDMVNSDPENPELGWRETDPDYWLEIEVLNMDDAVMWSGNTAEIASAFAVGFGEFGGWQNILIDVDLLLAKLVENGFPNVQCFYFRVKVLNSVPPYVVVNGDEAPLGPVPIGYTYIDFGTELINEWNGSAWVTSPPGQTPYYVAEAGVFYQYTGGPFPDGNWVGLAEPPELEDPSFEYIFTMGYRLRRCDEKVLHFESHHTGRDCIGFIHDVPYTTVDWMGGWNDPDGPLTSDPPYAGSGVWVLNQRDGTVSLFIDGVWVVQGPPDDGALFFVREGNTFDPGTGTMTVLPGSWWQYDLALQRWVSVPPPFVFQFDFKVAGSLEVETLPVGRELTKNGRLLSVTIDRVARMRSFGLPEPTAKLIQGVIGTDGFEINGETWDEVEPLKKNNDAGLHWWLNVLATRKDCEVDTRC